MQMTADKRRSGWSLSHSSSQRSSRVFPFISFLCALCVLCGWIAFADTSSDLRTVADGGLENWQTSANTSCSTNTCYTEVNESSGSTCSVTPSDGDASYNRSGTAQQTQTYDLSLATIPDGSTLHSATVAACGKGVSQTVTVIFRVRVDGTETACGSAVTFANGSYGDHNCAIDFADVVKSGATDFEIGQRNTQNRDARVSAVKATITYTPPTGGAARRVVILPGNE
jgi:hypothetical protein